MGFVWQNNDLDKLTTELKSMNHLAQKVAVQIVDETVREASWDMINMIETRGTGYKGHTGRVETGYMAGDVSDTQGEAVISGSRVTGRYGWGLHGVPARDYYIYQEQGFTNSRTGKMVPPMHALLDSFIKARVNLARKLIARLK